MYLVRRKRMYLAESKDGYYWTRIVEAAYPFESREHAILTATKAGVTNFQIEEVQA